MNPFLQLLKAAGAHPPLGTRIASASPLVAEAIGWAGFDWGVIDMEHGPLDLMGVVHLLQAVSATKMVTLVRVPGNDAAGIQRVLDAGAMTVLVPAVRSADEAARAVASTRHPPAGVRSFSGMSRAARFGTATNHFKNAELQTGLVVQLDSVQSVRQIESIAAVDGVDALFIDPADLAASMGRSGQSLHREVRELLAQAAQRCKAMGKPVGTAGATPQAVAEHRAAGFDFVSISSDLGLLMQSAQASLAALRTGEREHVHTLAGGTRSASFH
jgi:2-dehydro-3-deoxyglucarate aldolase